MNINKKAKMKYLSILTKSVLVIILFLILDSCGSITAGSYPYAERYTIHKDEATLIKDVIDFKIENPKYTLPSEARLKDGRKNKSLWYSVYFYYPKEGEIVFACLRPKRMGVTTLYLVSINEGLRLGNWKDINKDFDLVENNRQKKKFEELILKKISN